MYLLTKAILHCYVTGKARDLSMQQLKRYQKRKHKPGAIVRPVPGILAKKRNINNYLDKNGAKREPAKGPKRSANREKPPKRARTDEPRKAAKREKKTQRQPVKGPKFKRKQSFKHKQTVDKWLASLGGTCFPMTLVSDVQLTSGEGGVARYRVGSSFRCCDVNRVWRFSLVTNVK